MKPVSSLRGSMVPLDRADVDTDQIMPKQFLCRIERTGYGEFVFDSWRQEANFVLNDPRYAAATILVAGRNFGSGSSREHAAWGLQQYGFSGIVAPSFGDIFRNNCTNIGLLTAVASTETVTALLELTVAEPGAEIEINLEQQRLAASGVSAAFTIDPTHRSQLLSGSNPIAAGLALAATIERYESERNAWLPNTTGGG